MQHTMQAVEFESVINDGMIRIPDNIKDHMAGKVKVILLSGETTQLANKSPKPGSMKGKIWMADDFDAPLEDFKEYMG